MEAALERDERQMIHVTFGLFGCDLVLTFGTMCLAVVGGSSLAVAAAGGAAVAVLLAAGSVWAVDPEFFWGCVGYVRHLRRHVRNFRRRRDESRAILQEARRVAAANLDASAAENQFADAPWRQPPPPARPSRPRPFRPHPC